jgi:hypothetical protein
LQALEKARLSLPAQEEKRSPLPDDLPFVQEKDIDPFHVGIRDKSKLRRGQPRKSPLNDMPSDE